MENLKVPYEKKCAISGCEHNGLKNILSIEKLVTMTFLAKKYLINRCFKIVETLF
jgi:hypothetical protein